jgi:hypothetical protein
MAERGDEARKLRFHVRMLDGTALDIVEPETASVMELKQRLSKRLAVPVGSLKLLRFGSELVEGGAATLYQSKVLCIALVSQLCRSGG